MRIDGLSGKGALVLGERVVWAVQQPFRGTPRTECARDGGIQNVDPIEGGGDIWTDRDDLIWASSPPVRIRPDGTRIIETNVPRPSRNPAHDSQRTSAWIAFALWEVENDLTCSSISIDGRKVLLSHTFDNDFGGLAVAPAADGIVLRHGEGIEHVDADGRCTRIVTSPTSLNKRRRSVFLEGGHVLWSEEDEVEARLLWVPVGGGRTEVLERRALPDTFHLVDVYCGRALLREERWIAQESKQADIRGLEVRGVSVIDLPAAERRSSPAATADTNGASLHDPIERLPLSSPLVAKLRAEGIETIAQLRARLFELVPTLRTVGTGAFAEVRYALTCYEVFLRTPAFALRPIDAKFLAPASDLGLDAAIAKKVVQHAPSIAEIVTRSESDWLKTNGFGRGSLQKLKDALAAAGLELGRKWHELAS